MGNRISSLRKPDGEQGHVKIEWFESIARTLLLRFGSPGEIRTPVGGFPLP